MYRDIAIALSLANLCFMKAWIYVYYYLSMDNQYHSQLPPNINYYFAAVLNIFLLAAFFWISMTLARRSNKPTIVKVAKVVFVLTLIIPLNDIFSFSNPTDNKNLILIVLFLIALIILFIRMYVKFKKNITIITVKTILILFPFFLFNLFQPALTFLRIDQSDYADKTLAEAYAIKNQDSPRILWIIFDEMDQHLIFENRPITLELPEIDRFRSQAIYANNAYPPAGETDLSLPSLITGKIFSGFEAIRPNDLMLTLNENNQCMSWSKTPNIFSEVYDMGINTALIGWYHPYGRVLGEGLTSCSWRPFEIYRQASLSEAISQQIELFFNSIPFTGRFSCFEQIYDTDELQKNERIQSFKEMIVESKRAAVNPDLGLTLVHLPLPHPPGFYDSMKNDYSIKDTGYLDNLILADRSLGELRNSMEVSDTWDNTTVIITSDHWLRMDVWGDSKLGINENNISFFEKDNEFRVPFLIKLAGQKETLSYDQTFNTVLTHDLIIALLENELSSPGDVGKWIDSNRLNWSIPDYSSIQSEKSSQKK